MYPCFGRGDEEAQRPDGHDDAEKFAYDAEVGREEPEEDQDTDGHDQNTQAVGEEVGAVLDMPIVLSLIVLSFGHLVEGVGLDGLTFVVGDLIISVLEEEAHQRTIRYEGDDPVGFVVGELQATDPNEDDQDGYTDEFTSEAAEVAGALEE